MPTPKHIWRFIPDDRRLAHGDGRLIEAGKSLSVRGKLELCRNGLHGSERARDALSYVRTGTISYCMTGRAYIEDDNKLAARTIKTLWIMPATNVLIEWACNCAERVAAHNTDPRVMAAIDTVRRYLRGEATREECRTAYAHAAHAAYAHAAYAAAAYAAAYAAYAAAYAADATYAAADAAYAAADADAAAADAERDWQADELERLLWAAYEKTKE